MGLARYAVAASVLAVATAVFVGCTGAPAPTQSNGSAPSSTQSPSASAEPVPDPELLPDGSAEENQPYFDFVNAAILEKGNPGGRPIIDNLVSAGFDKAAMEVTADRTPLGNNVDSLQFSVRVGDDCLIGQAGAGGYTSTVAPALKSGSCLVGNTREIDW